LTKKGRSAKKHKAAKARQKAARRHHRVERACHLCGEDDGHLRRFEVRLDGKKELDWRLCRYCTATLTVLLRDRRGHKR
jgi:ribosomal protein S14